VCAIHDAVADLPDITISLDPTTISTGIRSDLAQETKLLSDEMAPDWVEIVSHGLTFDLLDLAPGQSITVPQANYRFDCPPDLFEHNLEALRLVPGPHLSGGENSLPVVRVLAGAASGLSAALSALALFWPPSGGLIGPAFFRSAINTWAAGGAFPALGLTGFKQMADGGMQSVGLAFFTGQEIRLEPDFAADTIAATQLGVRLVNQLVQRGTLQQSEAITAPDGSQLRLEPSGNGRFVRVWRG